MSYETRSVDSSTSSDRLRFELLVMPHLDALLAFARHRVPADADAEDLVREVCVRAWQNLDGLREDGKARAWLFRILRRLLLDRHRGEERVHAAYEVTPLASLGDDTFASPFPDPYQRLLSRLNRERVLQALDRIPGDFAMPVALHDIAGFQYREIAEILEIPLGTVMSRIFRGRNLLAGCIAPDGEEVAAAAVPRGTVEESAR